MRILGDSLWEDVLFLLLSSIRSLFDVIIEEGDLAPSATVVVAAMVAPAILEAAIVVI